MIEIHKVGPRSSNPKIYIHYIYIVYTLGHPRGPMGEEGLHHTYIILLIAQVLIHSAKM